jgi:hypothetical protein
LLNNQKLIGQDATADLPTIAGLAQPLPPHMVAFPTMNSGAPATTITTTLASTNAIQITNAANGTIRGLTIGNTTGAGIAMNSGATTFGTLTVPEVNETGTGQMLSLTGGTLTASYGTFSSSSSGNAVSLTNVNGSLTVSASSSAIIGATADDISINGGNLSFTYPGMISNTAGRAVSIVNKTGGTVAFSGAISDTNGSGIFLNANPSTTFTFSGGLSLSTGANAAFTATGGGTVNVVQDVPNNKINTITTTTGTALSVANTTIGASGITFRSISANGAVKGVVLNNTGAGAFTVTGIGTTDGSGGTIQNITTRGAEFIGVASVVLKNMDFTNANNSVDGGAAGVCDGLSITGCNSAIYLSGITTLATLDNLNVTGTMVENGITAINVANFKLDNSLVSGAGNEPLETGVKAQNLSGTVTFNNTTVQFSEADNVNVVNNDVNVNLTINGSSFNDTQTQSAGGLANTNGEGGFFFQLFSRASLIGSVTPTANVPTATINVINSSFVRNLTQGIQVFSSDDAILNIDITGCNIDSTTAAVGTGIDLNSAGTSTYSFNVTNNPHIQSNGGAAVNLTSFDTSHFEGRVNNNPDIEVLSGPGIPVRLVGQDGSAMIVEINGNTISNVNGTENTTVDVQSRFGATRVDATITNNAITGEAAGTAGIDLITGSSASGENTITCGDVSGNNVTNAAGNTIRAFRVRVSDLDGTSNPLIYLEGFVSGATRLASVENTWNGRSNLPSSAGGSEVLYSETLSPGNPTAPSAPPGGVCQQVDTPSDFLLFAPSSVDAPEAVTAPAAPASVERQIEQRVSAAPAAISESLQPAELSQDQLDQTVTAAMSAWIESGLNKEQLATLQRLTFEVADLPGLRLGEANGTRIRVNRNAGGNGWLLDAHGVDLLTTIMHEMGHALGLRDSYNEADRANLMYGFLSKGERRKPLKDQARGVMANEHSGTHFLGTPLNIGDLPAGKTVTITYVVTINSAATSISNQGTVAGGGFSPVSTSNKDGATVTGGATITPVELPPTVSNIGPVSTNEDNAVTLSAAVFNPGYNDQNGDPMTTVRIVSLPANGVLKLSGVDITAAMLPKDIAVASLLNLTYNPNANYYGNDSFGWNASDGTLFASTGATVNLTVNPINDAPTLDAVSNPAAIPEDSGQQTVNLSGISAGPANESSQTITVTASSGNTALIPNPTVTYTSPNAAGSIAYTPVANANGTATITVTVTDSGPTGGGNVNSFQRTFTVVVNAVNDAPVITGQMPVSTAFNTARTLTLNDLQVTDVDSAYPGAFTLTASTGANYSLGGDNKTITPALNFFGTLAVPVKVNDGAAVGPLDSNTYQLAMTVNPDPAYAKSATSIQKDPGGLKVSFVGNPGQQYTVQWSATLIAPSWQFISLKTADPNGTFFIIDNPAATEKVRFYRAIQP